MAARLNLSDEDRKIPYKARAPYRNKGVKRGRKPGTWLVGPDPRRHQQFIAWQRARAQANFRRETWVMTFEEFEALWNPNGAWECRGRGSSDLMMTRKDPDGIWSLDNMEVVERGEYLRLKAQQQTGPRSIKF